MIALLDHLVDWWMRRCPHAGADVAADILEGGWGDNRVAYCRRCGAVRFHYGHPSGGEDCGEWRRPRPLWCDRPPSRWQRFKARAIAWAGEPFP